MQFIFVIILILLLILLSLYANVFYYFKICIKNDKTRMTTLISSESDINETIYEKRVKQIKI